jgi:rhodanese-related sulfurtransferase|tara:strand:+ start:6417 stop:6788 length:372 start_codon:yes stop_codon:yes gene_type:complete
MAKKHSPKFLAAVNAARNDILECEPHEFREMLEDKESLVVIDVRERHEFEAGHLVNSVHIGKGVLERDIEKHDLHDEQRIVLYCGGGFRSAIAAKSLKEMGYSKVFSLWGGWRGILAEGLETE